MKYTYIHSATNHNLICVETQEEVYVDYPTSLEIVRIPNIVKDREMEAIERYEKENKMNKELEQKGWRAKENLAWRLLVTYAREYAKFMHPHQTIVIRCDGIELSSGDKVESFEVVD